MDMDDDEPQANGSRLPETTSRRSKDKVDKVFCAMGTKRGRSEKSKSTRTSNSEQGGEFQHVHPKLSIP